MRTAVFRQTVVLDVIVHRRDDESPLPPDEYDRRVMAAVRAAPDAAFRQLSCIGWFEGTPDGGPDK